MLLRVKALDKEIEIDERKKMTSIMNPVRRVLVGMRC